MSFLTVLQEIRTPFLNAFFLFCTSFGQELFCLAILCFLYWCADKKLACKIGFAFFLSGIFVQFLKIAFRVERPWVRDKTIVPVKGAMETATGYSFPSGHTQIATSLYATLILHMKRLIPSLLWGLVILLVGFSRIYLGVHTPQDVLASFLITLALTVAVAFFFERLYAEKQILTVFFLISFFSVALLLFSYSYYTKGILEEANISDCFKAAGAGIGFGTGYFLERTFIKYNEKSGGRVFRIIKYVFGISVLFGFRITFTALFGRSLPADFVRYLFMTLWTVAGYPALLKRFLPLDHFSQG